MTDAVQRRWDSFRMRNVSSFHWLCNSVKCKLPRIYFLRRHFKNHQRVLSVVVAPLRVQFAGCLESNNTPPHAIWHDEIYMKNCIIISVRARDVHIHSDKFPIFSFRPIRQSQGTSTLRIFGISGALTVYVIFLASVVGSKRNYHYENEENRNKSQ